MSRRQYLITGVAAIVLIGALAGVSFWYSGSLRAPDAGNHNTQLIRVQSGMSSDEIATLLKDHGLIRNPWAFRLHLRVSGASDEIQTGLYRLKPAMSAQEVARRLSSGETAVHSLTITPGMRLSQVTNLMKQTGYREADIKAALKDQYSYSVLADKPAKATLEGYLYPETYVVELETPVGQLVDLILSVTDERVTAEIRQAWANQGLNIHQGLTLASIVQKEVAGREDQRQVAQVFLKRLAIGMTLGADPTFEYGAALLGVKATTELDSPYNTYLHSGLPPGPIANPDAQALEAVADPANTDYLFFVSDSDGITHFTDNEDKHKQNIEEYLQ